MEDLKSMHGSRTYPGPQGPPEAAFRHKVRAAAAGGRLLAACPGAAKSRRSACRPGQEELPAADLQRRMLHPQKRLSTSIPRALAVGSTPKPSLQTEYETCLLAQEQVLPWSSPNQDPSPVVRNPGKKHEGEYGPSLDKETWSWLTD